MKRPDPIRALLDREMSRRRFLGEAAALVALGTLDARRADAAVRLAAYPFTLGVASGDPSASGVVLWTRLAPHPLAGGGMPDARVPVGWELASDEGFRRVVARGRALAVPELAHSVHVELRGLQPARHYWYRFWYGGEASPVGRTRTAPAAGSVQRDLRFAFVSCQNYEEGYYTAYRHLAEEELDLVVHLGDYIYEYSPVVGRPRSHVTPEIRTLDDYRNRYALYKTDPDLQAAHAAFPFVVTTDDHEVDNNYAGLIEESGLSGEYFERRRAAAYRAYYEHMPLRGASLPRGPDMDLYRRLPYGDLALFHVLDTRQYRTDQPCGDGVKPVCAAVVDPAATITGAAQERWLLEGLDRSTARWNVLANQLPITPMEEAAGPDVTFSMDKWDAYVHSRQRLLDFIATRGPSNPVVITGDVHANWASEIRARPADPRSPILGVELVGTSISSGGDGSDVNATAWRRLGENPHMKFYNTQRGYVRCAVTPELWTTDYRIVPYVSRPGAPVLTRSTLVVESGRPGFV